MDSQTKSHILTSAVQGRLLPHPVESSSNASKSDIIWQRFLPLSLKYKRVS